ncbi:peptide deformylase [Marinibacterium profundimaris]|uniref:Peptide deformylase n=1 Tax=Marinibacterium profundimaris TaxID=1679460 RepID=A0A225NH00_9RHOB|nr:peptide deformylase [Marinibacterium profundimaris]OWU71702.1 N-formylmethionyl-tRNA deformylase [Marinibacterium profundimaris]
MAVRRILTWPDPGLSVVCEPVGWNEDVDALIADMFDTMYDAPGRGLAAPQVGVAKRLFVMDLTWKAGPRSPVVMINPQIIDSAPTLQSTPEGCLSIPGLLVDVERPEAVIMAWTDRSGLLREEEFTGFGAVCVQHELDHLDGIVTFDRITPEARKAAEASYAGSPQ